MNIRLLIEWSSGQALLEIVQVCTCKFAVAKTFDANIAIIGNFVLIEKKLEYLVRWQLKNLIRRRLMYHNTSTLFESWY